MSTSAEFLREAAKGMAYADDKFANAVARLIADAARDYDTFVESISHPPVRGESVMRSLCHGQPENAAAAADQRFADAIQVARVWVEANPPASDVPDAAMYGARHFCTRCPDHEACASGWPCSVVKSQHAPEETS